MSEHAEKAEKMERRVEFRPAFDRRSADPTRNYGVHGMELAFILKGAAGAIQFVVYTNWHLRRVQEEHDSRIVSDKFPHLFCHPSPADLGYHSRVPQYEGHEPITESCVYLDGAPCYYDGSSLQAVELYWRFVEHGEDVVWETLEKRYQGLFVGEQ